MRKVLFVLIIIVPFSIFCQKVKTIAVMELDAVGISANEAKIITARLRTELFNSNKFVVLEREKVENILVEQGFQLSGCTSNECVVEAGQLLGVQQIVAGSIGKIGNIYTTSIRLIDIQTGKIIETATEDCRCSIEDVLISSIKNVAQILSGIVVSKTLAGKEEILRSENISNIKSGNDLKGRIEKKEFYYIPKIGLSSLSNIIGFELQIKSMSVVYGTNMFISGQNGHSYGLKYYLNKHSSSLYIALSGGANVLTSRTINYFGALVGYRWRNSYGFEFNLGIGYPFYFDKEYIPILEDLSIGYFF